jgi:hypothetical protein
MASLLTQTTWQHYNNEIMDAASILMELKSSTACVENDSYHPEYTGVNIDTLCYSVGALYNNSAWVLLLKKITDELCSIERFMMKQLNFNRKLVCTATIEHIFCNAKCATYNGYVAIQHGVTSTCNELRKILQQSLKKDGSDKWTLLTREQLCYEVVYYVNQYESYIWQQQMQHCHDYSMETELKSFEMLLFKIRRPIQSVTWSQRKTIFHAVQQNLICIEVTGLLAIHAYQHIVHILESICTVPIGK